MVSGRRGMPGSSQTGHTGILPSVLAVSVLTDSERKKSGCLPLTEGRVQLSRLPAHLGTHGERSPPTRFYPEAGRALPRWLGIRKAGGLSPSVFQGLHASSHLVDEHKSRVQDALMVPHVARFECIWRAAIDSNGRLCCRRILRPTRNMVAG